jgi:hypothetical protein
MHRDGAARERVLAGVELRPLVIADAVGTESVQRFTLQSNEAEGAQEQGSIRQVEEYRVHPNVLKTLKPGEAVVLYRSDHSVRRVRVLP